MDKRTEKEANFSLTKKFLSVMIEIPHRGGVLLMWHDLKVR